MCLLFGALVYADSGAVVVDVSAETDAAACVRAMQRQAPDSYLQLRLAEGVQPESPQLKQLLLDLEAAGQNNFRVDIRATNVVSEQPLYDTVVRRIASPNGAGWVQYDFAYDDECGVVSPFVAEISLRTPGGNLCKLPYESREYNRTPWSPDGLYLVLNGGNGGFYVIAVSDIEGVEDWEQQPFVETEYGSCAFLRWAAPHVFEFGAWSHGWSTTIYRYDIDSKSLVKSGTERNEYLYRKTKRK